MNLLHRFKAGSLISLVFLLIIFSRTTSSKGKISDDRQQIIGLEETWLASLHNKTVLDSVLAPDFIHPVSQGIFLTKSQHINWVVNHPDINHSFQKFDTLFVRVYKNTGIANGIVATYDRNGKLIRRSIFTDVFIKRKNRWQAVNGQENLIQ